MLEQLMLAAKDGDAAAVRQLLEQHPELLNASMPSGESPLTAALYYGRLSVVELLLDAGVSVTIHEAAALGDVDTLAYMLELEPNLLKEYSFDGWTPLHLSCFFGGYEAARFLIERGADVNARSANAMDNMPIHVAAAGKRTAIVQLLLEHGARPDEQQRGGWTPLQQAAAHCDAGMVKLLLDYGANPDLAKEDGQTARTIAEANDYAEVLNALDARSGQ